jgi:DNA-binding HxlR family transcriptional regulator
LTVTLSGEPVRGDLRNRGCPSRVVLDHLSSTWGVLVLRALLAGTRRFGELRRDVDGVSEKMLAQTLHALERDGLVERTAYPVIPPRVEYRLTDLGREAASHVNGLLSWIEDRLPAMLERQRTYDDSRAGTGD